MTEVPTAGPRVSILMAVHNGGEYLDEAVRSILSQTFTDFEFLIIDDGSTDGTSQRVEAYRDARIRLVRHDRNLGLTRSLNHGLELARGAYVARQDADDISARDRLSRQYAFLEANAEVAVVGAQARTIDAVGRTIRSAPWPKSTGDLAIRWQLMFDSPFVHASVMFRRDVIWFGLGGYDETFANSQDFELWTRVAAAGHQLRNLGEVLVDFRVHAASASRRYDAEGVRRLRPVLLRVAEAEVGANLPEGWPDVWIEVNNPQVFPGAPAGVSRAAHGVRVLLDAFRARHAAARRDSEIRHHAAAMFVRLAALATRGGRWEACLSALGAACRLSPAVAASVAPRAIARLFGDRGARVNPA